jgi:hypothetical protein
MKQLLPLLCLTTLISTALPSAADLVWYANFESYDTKAGAADLKISPTGEADSFTEVTITPDTLTDAGHQVVAGETGNALALRGTGTGKAGTAAIRLNQSALSVPGVLVISFDLTRGGKNGYSLSVEARSGASRSGKAVSLPVAKSVNGVRRAFIIINTSGAAIPLPEGLGELPDSSMATYLYDGAVYSEPLFSKEDVRAQPVAGFFAGPSRFNLDAGLTLDAVLDNFGAWTSVTDSVDGVNVLSLKPGTVVSKP